MDKPRGPITFLQNSPHVRPLMFVIAAGAVLGAAIWFLSPFLTGEKEPWDSRSWYYPFALTIAGVLAAAIRPRYFWAAPIGVCVGQVAFMFGSDPFNAWILIG